MPRKFSDEDEEDDYDDEEQPPPKITQQKKKQPEVQQKRPAPSVGKHKDSDSEYDDEDDVSSRKKSQYTKNSKNKEMDSLEDRKLAEIRKKKQKNFVKKEIAFDFTDEIEDKS